MLNGPSFVGVQVLLNGKVVPCTVASTAPGIEQLKCTVSSAHTTGAISLLFGGSTIPTSASVKVIARNTPKITSIPTSAARETAITINGTGFLTGATVKFNGVAATVYSVQSDTQIVVTIPTGVAGSVYLEVETSDGLKVWSDAGINVT